MSTQQTRDNDLKVANRTAFTSHHNTNGTVNMREREPNIRQRTQTYKLT